MALNAHFRSENQHLEIFKQVTTMSNNNLYEQRKAALSSKSL
jgi:hypothetical protein